MSIARRMQMGAAGVSAGGGGGAGDFTSASYDSSHILPATITNIRGIVISGDETKILVNDVSAATNFLTRVELATAGDLSTASVADASSIGSGTKSSLFLQSPSIVWAMDATADQSIKYTLNADFGNSISSTGKTAVPAGANPTTSDNPHSLTFSDDGSKMFIGDFNADGIQEFALSTNYNTSTATYTGNGDVSAQTLTPYAQCWNSDGTKMYVLEIGSGTSKMFQYSLSVAYDVSSKSYDGFLALDVGPLAGNGLALGIAVNINDNALYVAGIDFPAGESFIAKYSTVTPAAPTWTDPDLANASYDSVSCRVNSQESAPRGIFFKPDGTKMYVIGEGTDSVHEYDLSTAWVVSSESYLQNFSVSSQDVSPTSLFFKPDGSKMYVLGRGSDNVNEYDLSTAWDVTSSVYLQNFSVSSQDGQPWGLFFNTDGTKMYMSGLDDDVNEYTLSTGWDISSASYEHSFDVGSQEGNPMEVNFNPDGDKMYIAGSANDTIFEYDLSTAGDISTAVYNSISFDVSSQETNPYAFRFKADGSKLYVLGFGTTVYQYSTA